MRWHWLKAWDTGFFLNGHVGFAWLQVFSSMALATALGFCFLNNSNKTYTLKIKDTYRTSLKLPLLWGALHGINDWVAGFMLSGFGFAHSAKEGMLMLMAYAIIGFGGQLPVGMWLDESKAFSRFSKISLGLLIVTPFIWMINPFAGIVAAGFASAFVHVTGGAVCLETSKDKIGPLGVFTAPGVLGLALGTASAQLSNFWLMVPVLAVAIIGSLLLFNQSLSFQRTQVQPKPSNKQVLDSHDWIMLGILLTVTLRSLLYDIIQQVSQHWQQGLLVLGISAFVGKIVGGFLADKVGWKTWVYITLPLAFLLLQFGKDNIYLLGFGVACLQSSVPISLLLMRRSLPRYPGTSSAMVLGVGVAVAGLPMYVVDHHHFIEGWYSPTGICVALLLLLVFLILVKVKPVSV